MNIEYKRTPPVGIEISTIEMFGSDEEQAIAIAIQWAWANRSSKHLSMATAAELMQMPKSHLSNIISGKKYLPPQKINEFQWLVGNKAVTQTILLFQHRRKLAFERA